MCDVAAHSFWISGLGVLLFLIVVDRSFMQCWIWRFLLTELSWNAGNNYAISNESRTMTARVFFAQGCEMEASE